jgi:hypothetical protein
MRGVSRQATAPTDATSSVLQGGVLVSREGDNFGIDLHIVAPVLDNCQYLVVRASTA